MNFFENVYMIIYSYMLLQQIGCVVIWQIGVDDVIVKILEEN